MQLHMTQGLLPLKRYAFTLSSDENILKPVFPGLRLAISLSRYSKICISMSSNIPMNSFTQGAECVKGYCPLEVWRKLGGFFDLFPPMLRDTPILFASFLFRSV